MHVGSLEIDAEALAAVCKKWGVRELAVFGSAIRSDFAAGSDVDLLATFDSRTRFRMLKLLEMEHDFEVVFRRRVDLVERAAVEENPNWVMKRSILDGAQLLHVA